LKAGWRSGNESRGRPKRNAGVVRLLQWLDCNDVATLHDNGKKHKELEESDASVGNLWPSEVKMKLEIDVMDKKVRVWLKELSHSLEPEL